MSLVQTADLRPNEVHVDQVLTNFAVEYTEPMFVAEKLFPKVEVSKQSDKYPVYRPEEWLRIMEYERGPNAFSQEVDFSFSRDTFYCNDHALKDFVADSTLNNAAPDASRFLEHSKRVSRLKSMVLRRYEQQAITLATTSANFHTDLTASLDSGTANFDDTGISGVRSIWDWIDKIGLKTGATADQMELFMGIDVWRYVQADTNFRPSFATEVQTTEDAVRQLFGLGGVSVAQSIYSNTKKGQPVSRARLWPANTMLLAVTGSNFGPSFGRTFAWNAQDGSVGGERVVTWRDPMNRGGGGEYSEYSKCYDLKLTGIDEDDKIICGYLATNVYAAL